MIMRHVNNGGITGNHVPSLEHSTCGSAHWRSSIHRKDKGNLLLFIKKMLKNRWPRDSGKGVFEDPESTQKSERLFPSGVVCRPPHQHMLRKSFSTGIPTLLLVKTSWIAIRQTKSLSRLASGHLGTEDELPTNTWPFGFASVVGILSSGERLEGCWVKCGEW